MTEPLSAKHKNHCLSWSVLLFNLLSLDCLSAQSAWQLKLPCLSTDLELAGGQLDFEILSTQKSTLFVGVGQVGIIRNNCLSTRFFYDRKAVRIWGLSELSRQSTVGLGVSAEFYTLRSAVESQFFRILPAFELRYLDWSCFFQAELNLFNSWDPSVQGIRGIFEFPKLCVSKGLPFRVEAFLHFYWNRVEPSVIGIEPTLRLVIGMLQPLALEVVLFGVRKLEGEGIPIFSLTFKGMSSGSKRNLDHATYHRGLGQWWMPVLPVDPWCKAKGPQLSSDLLANYDSSQVSINESMPSFPTYSPPFKRFTQSYDEELLNLNPSEYWDLIWDEEEKVNLSFGANAYGEALSKKSIAISKGPNLDLCPAWMENTFCFAQFDYSSENEADQAYLRLVTPLTTTVANSETFDQMSSTSSSNVSVCRLNFSGTSTPSEVLIPEPFVAQDLLTQDAARPSTRFWVKRITAKLILYSFKLITSCFRRP